MNFPTWGDLIDLHCTVKRTRYKDENPFYESMSVRRYNYSSDSDSDRVRLVFLKSVLKDSRNKTLRRDGRFIWCKNINYEGLNELRLRTFSFTVDNGNKRFLVAENECLCVPSKSFINNNKFFRKKDKTFVPFSSVFAYEKSLAMMAKNSDLGVKEFKSLVEKDNPHKPGTLVIARQGYFYPESFNAEPIKPEEDHPCGIILGKSFISSDYISRELYRVRFGNVTYEKLHPVQMEII